MEREDRIKDPELKKLAKELAPLSDKVRGLLVEITFRLGDVLQATGHSKLARENYPVLGYWECAKSPVGVCVYDEMSDSIHDHCLFCGEPDERK